MLSHADICVGVRDALAAAAEEHDRDDDEVICPKHIANVWWNGAAGDEQHRIYLSTFADAGGRVYEITVREVPA